MNRIRLVFSLASALILVGACNPMRGPVVEEVDDGEVQGTLGLNRGKFNQGEVVRITFSIKNISDAPLLLRRNDAAVEDLVLTAFQVERRWSTETGEGLQELALAPGESSSIEWILEDLETGFYTISGSWWSDDVRVIERYISFEYGPARY